ncbi:hypothetical protein MTO98_25740 [Mucilaginibacter sp. SMC90]|uniref:hypothetical protein n=1 Tax=Mucilaginibacter sp. SMC90 TaxID=2929803 RepID=UPI001FB445D5|nr:hypothetical protein [Mucilaginibacter sp. SMC90]UOE47816.1 hypothetical protein MTO98_25740 [Mucilaginibacter sp. SMC90]
MNNEELTGRRVLVHPVLWDDPAEKNGEIGEITEVNLHDDLIRVKFDDQKYGFYGSDALLVFRSSEEIYDQLKQNAVNLSAREFKDLKNIALLLGYGKEPQLLTAMNMVRGNPEALQVSMISIADKLKNAEVRQIGR